MTLDTRGIDISLVAETFKLLGDPTRLGILLACLDAPRSVGEIAAATGASQSLVSHHLRLLRGARLVVGTRDARQVFYRAADQHVRHMIADIVAHTAEDPR
jgi:DNA-binding transcriptional ArsR family regulator